MRALVVLIHPVPAQLGIWREVAADGVDLHLAGTMHGRSREAFDPSYAVPDFGETHLFRPRGLVSRGQLWWVYPGLRTVIKKLKPDVVHVSSEAWGWLATQCVASPAPVVIHGADNMFVHGGGIEARIRVRVARHNLSRARGYVSWNRRGVELARTHGLRAGAPSLVAPFIAPEPESFRGSHTGSCAGGAPVVGFIGRLDDQKGADWLIDAVARVPRLIHLVLAGDGPAFGAMRARAEAAGVNARFLGRVPHEDVPGLLAGFDLVVVPSRSRPDNSEQFGRVILEAMHAGVPVIASSCGALPEVVGDAGICIDEGDVEALAEAIEKVVGNEMYGRELAEKGRERGLVEYAPSVIGRRIQELWRVAVTSS